MLHNTDLMITMGWSIGCILLVVVLWGRNRG